MKRASAGIIDALRSGITLFDTTLDALATLTRSVVETRGWPTDAAKQAFHAAGYGTRDYLEVIVGVIVKTLSDHINHAVGTSEFGTQLMFSGHRIYARLRARCRHWHTRTRSCSSSANFSRFRNRSSASGLAWALTLLWQWTVSPAYSAHLAKPLLTDLSALLYCANG